MEAGGGGGLTGSRSPAISSPIFRQLIKDAYKWFKRHLADSKKDRAPDTVHALLPASVQQIRFDSSFARWKITRFWTKPVDENNEQRAEEAGEWRFLQNVKTRLLYRSPQKEVSR